MTAIFYPAGQCDKHKIKITALSLNQFLKFLYMWLNLWLKSRHADKVPQILSGVRAVSLPLKRSEQSSSLSVHSQIWCASAPAAEIWGFCCIVKRSSHCWHASVRPWGSSSAWMWCGSALVHRPSAGLKGQQCCTGLRQRGVCAAQGCARAPETAGAPGPAAPQWDLLLCPHKLCGRALFHLVTLSLRNYALPHFPWAWVNIHSIPKQMKERRL